MSQAASQQQPSIDVITVFSSVSCANEWASDAPDKLVVQISADDAKRIKKLAAAVKDLRVEAIEDFDFGATYSSLSIDFDSISASNVEQSVLEIENAEDLVDIPMLRVTNEGFYFTAVPKHMGDDMQLSSKRISFDVLDAGESVVTVE